jgi:hypothetical protein
MMGLLFCLLFADPPRETTVGMEMSMEGLVLPGTELEVMPLEDRRSPLVVRIIEANPHGTAFRYHLAYYALEPGTYDLRTALRRKDGSALGNLPELKFTAKAILPPGQILPNDLKAKSSPFVGGYRLALIAAGVLWVIGLLAIIFVRRKKRIDEVDVELAPTMADRLRPLVEKGMKGELSLEQRADLERALLGYWKKRLRLEEEKPAAAFATLRHHADAGPLLNQLETWLHRPGQNAQVDITSLLKPYRNLPADALQLTT